MIELKGTTKEVRVREWLNAKMDGSIPLNTKVIDVFRMFEIDNPDISYGCVNSTLKKVVAEGNINTPAPVVVEVEEELVPEVINIEDMDFPNFDLFQTKKKIDELWSDHEEGGGLYSGTVNIVIGESGSGKSTVLLDMLASIQDNHPEAKILYVSSEMTRNDILFYYKKTPSIAKVPTLLLMDYVKNAKIDKVLEATFTGGYDIIVLDSYQDVVVKLKEVQGWKSTYAESWLTNSMISGAEDSGTAILAIQHMTKGGQYVGSTYLKHATTAMMEILFDDSGLRYIEFSKNRRGGSGVGKRLYFYLENGDIKYDTARYDETLELKDIESKEAVRHSELSSRFEDIFKDTDLGEEDENSKVITVNATTVDLAEQLNEDVE